MPAKKDELLTFAMRLAKQSGRLLQRMQKKAKIKTYKGKGDFAMDADVISEKHILQCIKKKYPDHDILTEETGHLHKTSDYLWIIDPLEGTLNYAHGLPLWGVNIGLFYKGKPYLGVIYLPTLKELFHAVKGKGAYLNGKKIHVSTETRLTHAFYSGSINSIKRMPFSKHLLRAPGCGGLELSYVACGRYDARIKFHDIDPYGYGAGSILVLEAGGTLTDSRGKPWTLKSDGAIASNGKIHRKLLNMIKPLL